MRESTAKMSCLADGDYFMKVVESHHGRTCFGVIQYVELVFKVRYGLDEGHRIRMRLYTQHPDAKKVTSHRAAFKALTRAVGRVRPDNLTDFHNRLLIAHVQDGQLVKFQAPLLQVSEFLEKTMPGTCGSGQSDASSELWIPRR